MLFKITFLRIILLAPLLLLTIQLNSVVTASTNGRHGIDVSELTSVETFQCLKRQGKTFVVVRVLRSFGRVDTNAPETIRNAWEAGMAEVDGYIYPKIKEGNPRSQVNTLIDYLDQEHSVRYGILWLDVENVTHWGESQAENIAFIEEMVNELKARGKSIGIYTSESQWTPITGGTTKFAILPLWYPKWSGENPSFSDFERFGGWQNPTMKQFTGDKYNAECQLEVDDDWKP